MSEVNGLGIYLLFSLGFVFSALIEFAIIISLKRRAMNRKLTSDEDKKPKLNKVFDANQEIRKFQMAMEKFELAKNSHDANKEKDQTLMKNDFEFLQRVDFHSLIAYLIAYVSFNVIYWIDMLFY